MMQSKRRLLSKSSNHHCPALPHRSSIVARWCVVYSLILVVYLNYRFTYSVLYRIGNASTNGASISTDWDAKRQRPEFLSLPAYPDNSLTSKSGIEELERDAENIMVGSYRYSPITALQLPYADLEETKTSVAKDNNAGGYLNDDTVVLTRKGHKFNPEDGKRTPNQDRVVVLSRQDDTDWWMGLFDGHGYHGHVVSQFVSSEFMQRISNNWLNETADRSSRTSEKSNTMIKNSLRNMFLEINRSIPSVMSDSGCTAISVLKKGNSLFISNVGDSVVFVASCDKSREAKNEIKIIYSNSPHKPDIPSERERIEASGGRVQDPIFEGASARLLIPVKIGSQLLEIGLAMSRSLGDHDGLKVGLSPEPDTSVLDLSKFDKNQEFIVVAVTDGMVDFGKLSDQEVALSMAKAFSMKQTDREIQRFRTNLSRHPQTSPGLEAAIKLILEASQLWDFEPGNYRDDISIVARKLRL
mmetsp:Transcript_12895/g.30144  ORF Transcript_12895/g.30144 Transcript_12895/m.30144 type:complete len:470 (-) Transcript_12895:222-1631(-)